MMKQIINPMLCKSIQKETLSRLDTNEWISEPKIDGSRAILFIDFGENYVRLQTRSGADITQQFPELSIEVLREALSGKVRNIILDGELICSDMKFSTVQGRCHQQSKTKIDLLKNEYPATLITFDILWLNNKHLTQMPLVARKDILKNAIIKTERIQKIPVFTADFEEKFKSCVENGFEGIVLKNLNTSYNFNERGWLKCRKYETEELEITGWDRGDSGEALVLETSKGRISVPNAIDMEYFHTMEPKLVEVKYQETSVNDKMRFPQFIKFGGEEK